MESRKICVLKSMSLPGAAQFHLRHPRALTGANELSWTSQQNSSLDPRSVATLVRCCSWAAKSCIGAVRPRTGSQRACVPGWTACTLNFTITLQTKISVKFKGKVSCSFHNHILPHLLQKEKHPNIESVSHLGPGAAVCAAG